MVYESDFYTTRRPYSRPLVTSYSVTRPIVIPLSSIIQLRGIPYMPYIAHKRLVTIIHTPVRHVYYGGAMIPIRVRARVRPSVLSAELSRIRDLPRPTSRSYIEEYLNSRNNILFDDETREIRAKVDSLLRRVHVFVPRAVASDFVEEIVPERMRSHDYVRRLISGRNNAKKDVEYLSWYEIPERGTFGTLACIKYVAGKPQSVRRPYFKMTDLRPIDIRNDVNFLSYYSKNRQAAATASSNQPMTEREVRKARALGVQAAPQEEKLIPASEPETKSEEASRKAQEKEPEPVEEPENTIAKITEEPIESVVESVAEPAAKPASKSAKSTRSAKSAKSAKKAEAEAVPVSIPESTQEPESPVVETEPVVDSQSIAEPEVPKEPVAEEVAPSESSETNAVSEKVEDEKLEKVRQEKEDAVRRAEEYLAKAAREAQSEEERRKAAEEERLQLEAEERKAWEALQLAQERKAELGQILETERQEAERKAEELKEQTEREEMEKIEENERLINQAKLDALIQEQERLIVEEHLEEVQQQKQEQEAADITQVSADEPKELSCAEDPIDQADMTDQEKEEKLYDVTTDDETRVEEENVPEEEHVEITEETFVEEPAGAENKPQTGPLATEVELQIEEATSGEEFEWGDQDT